MAGKSPSLVAFPGTKLPEDAGHAPDPETVDILRQFLFRARRGEIQSVVVIGVEANGAEMRQWHIQDWKQARHAIASMLGVQHALLQEMINTTEELEPIGHEEFSGVLLDDEIDPPAPDAQEK